MRNISNIKVYLFICCNVWIQQQYCYFKQLLIKSKFAEESANKMVWFSKELKTETYLEVTVNEYCN